MVFLLLKSVITLYSFTSSDSQSRTHNYSRIAKKKSQAVEMQSEIIKKAPETFTEGLYMRSETR